MSDDWQVVEEALCPNYPSLLQYEAALASLARLREREAQNEQTRTELNNRVAELEEALRRIEEIAPDDLKSNLARRAVAHKEEKP